MPNMVERILRDIENGKIEIDEDVRYVFSYPRGLRLLSGFTSGQIYGFDRE
jgi:hypothetical protein